MDEIEKKNQWDDVKALIFDVDGTLWDTTDAAAQIWSDVAAKYPEITDTITAEKLRSLYGLPLEEIAVKLFEHAPKELAIRVMEECVQVQCPVLATGVAHLIGPVRETLAQLSGDYQIFIVSNCRSGYIESLLTAHELGEYVTDFTCPGETGLLKADNIRLICERNGVSLSDAVYIGDTRADELASREAGVPFIFAAYGFGSVVKPDATIFSIADLKAELNGQNRLKIVFMETDTLGKDVDLSGFDELGEVVRYPKSEPAENAARIKDADIVITNKTMMNEEMLADCDKLKLICLTATGTNNVDFPYVNARGIKVANVKGYSTDSVAQHTFALLLYIYEKLHFYDHFVKEGGYVRSDIFSCFDVCFHELAGKKFGIVGLGNIGRKVAQIATDFGCEVVYYSTGGAHDDPDYRRVDKEALFRECDIISIHAPLNEKTRDFVGREELAMMKKDAVLLNLGRGPIVNQEALAEALEKDMIGGAALDVLTVEPMAADNPLLRIQDSQKLIITPHIAWATTEARQRCADEVRKNIQAFLIGESRNLCRA